MTLLFSFGSQLATVGFSTACLGSSGTATTGRLSSSRLHFGIAVSQMAGSNMAAVSAILFLKE